MLISKKKLFCLCFCLTPFLLSAAQASDSETPFGLPASATMSVDQTDPAGTSTVIGLPGSTQAASERIGAYLYVSYNSAHMSNSTITTSEYTSSFGSSSFGYP